MLHCIFKYIQIYLNSSIIGYSNYRTFNNVTLMIPPVLEFEEDLFLSISIYFELSGLSELNFDNQKGQFVHFRIGTDTHRYLRCDKELLLDTGLNKKRLNRMSISYKDLDQNDPRKLYLKLLLLNSYYNFKKYICYYQGNALLVDQLYKYAKSHAILEIALELNKNEGYTVKEIFETLNCVELNNLSFKIKSAKYFYSFFKKVKSFHFQGRLKEVVIHGLIGKPSNYAVLNKTVIELIIYFGRHINKPSAKFVMDNVNAILLIKPSINGGKIIKLRTVQEVLARPYVKNLITCHISRDSSDLNRMLPYLLLSDAENSCDLIEMDFTKLNFAVKDNLNNVISLTICYIQDNYSKKILAFGLDHSENSALALRVFERAIVTIGNKLPHTFISDMSSAYDKDFGHIIKYLETKSIVWKKSKNPKRKATVERLIQTIQTVFLRPEIGYIGEGIKSKREKGRVGTDMILILNNSKYLKNFYQTEVLLAMLIKDFNNTEIKENLLTPNEKFRNSKKINSIRLEHWEIPILFWKKHQVTGDAGVFKVFNSKKETTYVTYNEDLLLKIGNVKIDLYNHEIEDKIAYAFELDTYNYIGQLDLHSRLPRAKINQTKKHKQMFAEHFRKREILKNAILNKIDKMDENLEKVLGALPDQLVDFRVHDKKSINDMEFRNSVGIKEGSQLRVSPYRIKPKPNKKSNETNDNYVESNYLKQEGSGRLLK
jgi:hypothetical protein